MGVEPVLPITVAGKKIKGAAHQYYGGSDRVVRCELTLVIETDSYRADRHTVFSTVVCVNDRH